MPKILIADDSIAVRKVAERLLTEAGMGVTLAANGSEALAILSKDRPDLIVSDVIMPDKSGYEVCSFVRAQPNLSEIPVLLISGIVNDEVSRQAETCKADGVLKKPFQGTSLKDRVLDLLAKRQPKTTPPTVQALGKAADAHPGQPMPSAAPVHEEVGAHAHPEPAWNEGDRELHAAAQLEPIRSVPNEVEAGQPSASPHRESAKDSMAEADRNREAALAERAARIAELEQQLERERQEGGQRMQELRTTVEEQQQHLSDFAVRVKELDSALAEERAQRLAITEELSEVSKRAERVPDLESALADERQRTEQLAIKVEDSARQAARIHELEATLTAERDAATQLVQQLTRLEEMEAQARDFESKFAAERDHRASLSRRISELEDVAARVPHLEEALEGERGRIADLDTTLSTERETARALLAQVKELEQAVQKARELDTVLASERERSTQLAKRASEAEQMADLSNRRLEDMARKLAEIAGLASQLGSGKR
jgi:CheY-like chemotaxis protein